MRNSKNPVLGNPFQAQVGEKLATRRGIVGKTFLGLIIMVLTMVVTMNNMALMMFASSIPFMIGVTIVFIVMMIKMNSNPALAKPFFFFYSIVEGMMLSSIVLLANTLVPGIAFQAAFVVMLIFALMLFLYTAYPSMCKKMIPVIMVVSLLAFGFMFISFIFGLFGASLYAFGSTTDLVITGVLVLIASFNYFIDFAQVEAVVENNAPKVYEYTAALGLLTTTVWLFIEVLRLLLILASRNDD